jgi:hypothetical protein
MSAVGGTFETCPPILECPFTRVDRKSPWSGQTDANDPERSLTPLEPPVSRPA